MDCVFCRLIREDTARWVAREPEVCAFAPLDPLAPGHTLVVPTRHHPDVFDTPPDVLAASAVLVQRVAAAMRTGLGASGVNVLSASGPGSEQSVAHLHFHVVPRWADDGISTWPAGRSRHRIPGDPVARLAGELDHDRPPHQGS
ncbi:HIT family protein [Streptomyces sp. NPDC087218]|uniref:HIT family protein n=1 Tax=unclassified Streptomyces TaxID=2593676 RepID=UPI003695FF5D